MLKDKRRAGYGEQLMERLSLDLTEQFGRGYSPDNLENMRRFFLAYPMPIISETVSGELTLTKGAVAKPEDAITPDEAVIDPYMLEFLNLKDE